ncbi:MAG: asparaginase [bacterium]|jgi:L-asparaginase II
MSEILVQVTRGDIVECVHRGSLAIVDSTGKMLFSAGSPGMYSYLRSSAKPIQAIPVVESGAADHFSLTEREIAVFCASHSGEEKHTETVLGILAKIGVEEEALQCGTHLPLYGPCATQMVREGRKSTARHSNCSGKHSGMLTYAVYKGYPLEGYYKPEHPVQKAALAEIAYFAGMDPQDIVCGVDGCGVVVFAMPVYNMAYSFARLADPDQLPVTKAAAVKRITAAMRAYPEMIAGTDRFCTDLMTAAKGKVFAKSGAEGVYCVGIPERKLGIALKIDDGNSRGIGAVIVEVLLQMGVLGAEEAAGLQKHHKPVLHNFRGDTIGEIRSLIDLDRKAW